MSGTSFPVVAIPANPAVPFAIARRLPQKSVRLIARDPGRVAGSPLGVPQPGGVGRIREARDRLGGDHLLGGDP